MTHNIPDFQSLMLPMLTLLSNGKEQTLNEVIQSLAAQFNVTAEELKIKTPSGQMGLFRNRVGWTRSYLKNAGLIVYPNRGVYKITPEGKAYLSTNPQELRIKQLKTLPQYKDWVSTFNQGDSEAISQSSSSDTETKTPEEILAFTTTQLKQQLASELLDKLKENTFGFFEGFVILLLQKMGYGEFREGAAQVTGKVGDDGIDGIIHQDRLGLEAVYIQAKRYSSGSVGSPEIRNFIGSLALKGVNKGVFLTTSKFTDSAKRTALESQQQKIVLLDGKALADLAIEVNLGVQTEDTIEIKRIDLDFFEE